MSLFIGQPEFTDPNEAVNHFNQLPEKDMFMKDLEQDNEQDYWKGFFKNFLRQRWYLLVIAIIIIIAIFLMIKNKKK